MSFIAEETSREQGAPIELYTITHGSTIFRYTTSEDTLNLSGDVFTAIEISRGSILVGPEHRTQSVEVEMKSNNEFAARFIGIQPSAKATVVIERLHRFDALDPDERVQIFKGQVRAIAFTGNGFRSKLSLMPLSGALSKTVPLDTFQSPCNNVLFDSRCKVVRSAFQFVGTVTVVSPDGLTLTVPGLDASKGVGFATRGTVEIVATGDPRKILAHTATNQITVLLPYRNSPLGSAVNVLAGCAHDATTCNDKFSNIANFKGHAFVPTRNPFQTGLN